MGWSTYAANSWVQTGSPSDPEVWAFDTRQSGSGAMVLQIIDPAKPVGARIYGSPLLDTCYEVIFTTGTGGNIVIRKWSLGTVGSALDTAAHGLTDGDNYTLEVRWINGVITAYLNGSTTAAVEYDTSNDLATFSAMGFASEDDGARVGSARIYTLTQTFAALADVAWWVAGGTLYASDSGRNGGRAIGTFFDPAATVVGAEDQQHAIIVDGSHAVDFDAVLMTAQPFTLDAGKMPGQSALNTPLGTTTAKVVLQYNSRVGFLQEQYAIFSALGDRADLDLTVDTEGKAFIWPSQVGEPLLGAFVAAKNRLIMWGRRSTWEMTGDPVLGADVTRISSKTGGTGPYSACMVEQGIVLIHSDQGLQIIRAGGLPQPLSEMVLTDIVNTESAADTMHATVVQDTRSFGVWIFLTPRDGTQGRHVFYDERTGQYNPQGGGFWPIRFGDAGAQPTCAMRYQGEVVFGTLDGRMMYMSEAHAGADGGDDYTSKLMLQAVHSEDARRGVLISEIGLIMGLDSDPTTMTIYGGHTPERAFGASHWTLMSREIDKDRRRIAASVSAPATVIELTCDGGQFSLEAVDVTYKRVPIMEQPRRPRLVAGTICQPPAAEEADPGDGTEAGPGEGTDPGDTCTLCESWMAANTTGDVGGEAAYELTGGGHATAAAAAQDAYDNFLANLLAEDICSITDIDTVVMHAVGSLGTTWTGTYAELSVKSLGGETWSIYFRCGDQITEA